jgi:hypothetical protein
MFLGYFVRFVAGRRYDNISAGMPFPQIGKSEGVEEKKVEEKARNSVLSLVPFSAI